MGAIRTNPNGANQYQLDPRQKLCWENYIDPRSETRGNAKQSAIKAGYTEGTANMITTEEWFKGKLRRLNMRIRAEEVLKEMMEMDDTQELIIDGQPSGVMKRDPALTRIKQDTAKFAVERLGKEEWSQRNELSGPNGKDLLPVDEAAKAKADKAIYDYLDKPVAGDIEQGNDAGEESAVSIQPGGQDGDGATEVQPLG